MTLREKFDRAWDLKKSGARAEALSLYKEVHDAIVDRAHEIARSKPGAIIDDGEARAIMPQLFSEMENILREDEIFCVTLNNMGVIYAESGDKESAKRCFEDAIKFTPRGVDYQNPIIGLRELEKRQA